MTCDAVNGHVWSRNAKRMFDSPQANTVVCMFCAVSFVMGAAGSPDLLCVLENNADNKTSLIRVRIT